MTTFTQLGIHQDLLGALETLGFQIPTPVQALAIPYALKKEEDLIVVAQTGTGKTASFALPLLTHLTQDNKPQGLILAPTRELALQITKDIKQFTQHMSWINSVTVYGGADINQQIKKLQRGAHVIVATPGRLLDLYRRGHARLNDIQYLILDEADEMLNMGFKDEIDAILESVPQERHTWLFSATMAEGVKKIASRFMQKPKELRADASTHLQGNTLQRGHIDHIAYEVKAQQKLHTLVRLIDVDPTMYAIVFCRTRRDVQALEKQMKYYQIAAGALHGDMSQMMREQVMGLFRKQTIKILIATDIAARGLDVNDLTHVIHYDLPDTTEAYTHRSGRTARAGRSGYSVIMVTARDRRKAQWLARSLDLIFPVKEVPSASDVLQSQAQAWVHQLMELPQHEDLTQPLTAGLEVLQEKLGQLTHEELVRQVSIYALQGWMHSERLAELNVFAHKKNNKRRHRGQTSNLLYPDSRQAHRQDSDGSSHLDQRNRGRNRDRREGRDQRDRRDRRDQRDRRDHRDHRDQRDRRDTRPKQEHTRKNNKSSKNHTTQSHLNQRNQHWVMVEVNAGESRGLKPAELKARLQKQGIEASKVGQIRMHQDHTYFAIQEKSVDQALKAFKGFKLQDQRVSARRR